MFLVWLNAQVSGLLNVLSQILSCERFKLLDGILRMAKEPQLAREHRKELVERKRMDGELLERTVIILISQDTSTKICIIHQSFLSQSYRVWGRSR